MIKFDVSMPQMLVPLSASASDHDVEFTDGTKADLMRRKIIDMIIWQTETVEQLDDYYESEGPMIEAIGKYDGGMMAQTILDAYQEQRLILQGAEECEKRNAERRKNV